MLNFRSIASLILATTALSAMAQFSGPAPLAWRWSQPTNIPPKGGPAADGDLIFVASGQRVYGLNRVDGNQKWRFPVGEPLAANFKSSAVLGSGLVLAVADNRTLYALDEQTGVQKWIYQSQLQIVNDPVVIKNSVVFALSDGTIMAVKIDDGTPVYTEPLVVNDGANGQIAAWGDDMLVFSSTGTLYAISAANREIKWHDTFNAVSVDAAPVATSDTIYVASGSFLVALNAGTGREKYTKTIESEIAFSPAASSDGVMVLTRDGHAFAFDSTGAPINRDPVDVKSDPFVRPTALPGGLYVVPTINGDINLVDPKAGVVWDYPVRPIGGIQNAKSSTTTGGPGGNGFPGGPGGGPGNSPDGNGAGSGSKTGGQGIGRGGPNSSVNKIVTIVI